MDFKELFPEVITKQEVKQSEDYIIVEQDGHVLHFPKSSLTKRELYLLQMTPSLEDASSVDSQNPSLALYVEGRGRLPNLIRQSNLFLLSINLPYQKNLRISCRL